LGLFVVIFLGLGLGRVRVKGITLGSSGVLFVALVLGHLGTRPPEGVGVVGLVIFLYCIGLSAGPGFFSVLARQGLQLGKIVLVVVCSAALATVILARWVGIPSDLALGVFAGAMTSTPALAAAQEAFLSHSAQVAIGYGIAYPIGVVGVVLYVQLLPQLLKIDLAREEERVRGTGEAGGRIERVLVEVINPGVFHKRPRDLAAFRDAQCVVSRELHGERLTPLAPEFEFSAGQHVLLVGQRKQLDVLTDVLGKQSDRHGYIDSDNERLEVVVASRRFARKAIRDLDPLRNYGVTISRITRYGASFVPSGSTQVQRGDVLTVVGEQTKLRRFAADANSQEKLLHQSDLISLSAGIAIGLLLGQIPIGLPGGQVFRLGLAGGPLTIGLILAHFGRIGGVIGYLPRASRMVLMDFGLVLFLAASGCAAGESLVEVMQSQGVSLLICSIIVTLVPIAAGHLYATYWLRLPLLEVFGTVCGGMTSTPGLAAVTSKTDSDAPMIAYAATYPVSLVILTILVQWLVHLL
jgi:putative transport protein